MPWKKISNELLGLRGRSCNTAALYLNPEDVLMQENGLGLTTYILENVYFFLQISDFTLSQNVLVNVFIYHGKGSLFISCKCKFFSVSISFILQWCENKFPRSFVFLFWVKINSSLTTWMQMKCAFWLKLSSHTHWCEEDGRPVKRAEDRGNVCSLSSRW